MGKKAFLSFPVPPFFGTLSFPVLVKIVKTGEKKGGTVKSVWKDVERGCGAVLALSRFSNLARFLFFIPFETRFARFKTCS